MKETVGIIGGAGAEGTHVAEIIQNSGLEVVISDINYEKAKDLCNKRNYSLLSSEELVKTSNLVLFSLPIEKTILEMKRLVPLSESEAIADLTSIKTKSIECMLKYSDSSREIFGVHLMYRPTISPWGQNMLMIPSRPKEGGKWFNKLKEIFNKHKANISILEDAISHDNEMAPLQIEPQSIAYAFISTLDQLSKRVGLDQLQKHSTLLFRLMMDAAGRVVSDPNSGKMYGSIQIENPAASEVYDMLIGALQAQKDIICSGNLKTFEDMHKKCNAFLGEYARIATERTDKMMGHPLGLPLYYKSENRSLVEGALGVFRKAPERYKEDLETATILEGEINKLQKKSTLAIARQVFYKARDAKKEGNFAFYITNKNYPDSDKGISFSPIIPENAERAKQGDPLHIKVRMFNRFYDPFLNLFDSWERMPALKSLGTLVAYGKY